MAVAAMLLLTVGTADIPLPQVMAVMFAKIVSGNVDALDQANMVIVWDIRWPRIALAILVGSSLAVAGTCYQTIFRNPLADPFILGVSSGAALGAAIAIVLHLTAYMALFAFIGSTATMALVYFFGSRGHGIHYQQLLLAGVAIGALFNATLSCLMAFHAQQLHAIFFWLMGSLAGSGGNLSPIALLVGVGFVLVIAFARDLDIISLGDETASFLGVDVAKVKFILLLSTTLITAAVVSVSGIIGFVGLVVPHILRRIIGPNHILLLPASAAWGAIMLLLADAMTRLVVSLSSIPVGIITALLGSPFFLYILYTTSHNKGDI